MVTGNATKCPMLRTRRNRSGQGEKYLSTGVLGKNRHLGYLWRKPTFLRISGPIGGTSLIHFRYIWETMQPPTGGDGI